jgi:hypothetical protein
MDELYQDESDHWLFNAQQFFFFFLLIFFFDWVDENNWHWFTCIN